MISELKNAFQPSEADALYFDRDDRERRSLRAKAMMLGIVIYLPYCIFDVFAFPEQGPIFIAIRGFATMGMVMACLWFIRASTRMQREMATLVYGAFGLGGMFTLSVVNPDAAIYFHFGAAVSIMYGGATLYLRPALVILICIGVVPSYILSLSLSGQNAFLEVIDAMLMATVVLTVAASNIYRYKLERQQYENERALIQAKLEAENALARALESDRAKDNLLAGVSHELRTPMNAIIGFSDAMRCEIFGTVQPEPYRAYVDHIHDSGLILKRNINDLLDLSSLSVGTSPLQETRFCLTHMVANAVRLCTFRAKDEQIDLRITGDDLRVKVHADRERLEQAIINLVINAIKFTPAGKTVTIAVHPPTEDGVIVSVHDEGRGISRAALDRITSPFVQEHADNFKRGSGGLGIGLAIVTNIMRSMGGTMTIESAEGEGTVVSLLLPRDRIVEAPAEIPNAPRTAPDMRRKERLETG